MSLQPSANVPEAFLNVGLKIYREKKEENLQKYDNILFKALYAWMIRSISRRDIKVRKSENCKEHTAEKCITDFEDFLHKLRFGSLQPLDNDSNDLIHPVYERFL